MTREELTFRRDSDLARMSELKPEVESELPKSGPRTAGVGFSENGEEYEYLASEVEFVDKLLLTR
jgi:hypothetical protein